MAEDSVLLTPAQAIDILVSNFDYTNIMNDRFFFYYKESVIEGNFSLKDNYKNFERLKKKIIGNNNNKSYVMVTNLEFNKGLIIKPVYFQFALFDPEKRKPTRTVFVKMPNIDIDQIINNAKALPMDRYTIYLPGFRHVFFRNLTNVRQLENLVSFDDFLDFFKKIKIEYYINPNMSDGDHILYKLLKSYHEAEVWCATMEPVQVKGYKTEIDRFILNQKEGGCNEIFPIRFPDVVRTNTNQNKVLFDFKKMSHYFKRYQMINFEKFKKKKKFCSGKVLVDMSTTRTKLVIDNKKDFMIDFYIDIFKNLQFIMPQLQVSNSIMCGYFTYQCDLSWQQLYHSFTLILGIFSKKIRKPHVYEVNRHCNELQSHIPEVREITEKDFD